jgi:hypothetical protein
MDLSDEAGVNLDRTINIIGPSGILTLTTSQ